MNVANKSRDLAGPAGKTWNCNGVDKKNQSMWMGFAIQRKKLVKFFPLDSTSKQIKFNNKYIYKMRDIREKRGVRLWNYVCFKMHKRNCKY